MSNIITLDTSDSTVKAVVTQIKSDMRGGARYAAYVAKFSVTRENVTDHAEALAALVTDVTPQTKDGKRTKYGNALQAAKAGLTRSLDKDETDGETPVQALLTKAGFAATLEEVTAAWKSAQV